jgi:hypothetical protein
MKLWQCKTERGGRGMLGTVGSVSACLVVSVMYLIVFELHMVARIPYSAPTSSSCVFGSAFLAFWCIHGINACIRTMFHLLCSTCCVFLSLSLSPI